MSGPTDRSFDILIADDNPADFAMLREGFLEAGLPCGLHYVRDGREAVRFLEQQDRETEALLPSLVILDARMPHGTGFEVFKRMKSHLTFRKIPVVLLSGLFYPGERESAVRTGALCFEKPLTLEGWIDLVGSVYAFATAGKHLCAVAD